MKKIFDLKKQQIKATYSATHSIKDVEEEDTAIFTPMPTIPE